MFLDKNIGSEYSTFTYSINTEKYRLSSFYHKY